MPSRICTGATRGKSKTSGTPSSVKAQMKTSAPPANRPGVMMGRVTRVSRRQGEQPRLAAACSMAGSICANAAARLR